MARIEEKINNVETKFDSLNTLIAIQHKDLCDKFDKFFENADKKYAAKHIEQDVENLKKEKAPKWVATALIIFATVIVAGALWTVFENSGIPLKDIR